jgi:hypothetical protein
VIDAYKGIGGPSMAPFKLVAAASAIFHARERELRITRSASQKNNDQGELVTKGKETSFHLIIRYKQGLRGEWEGTK